MTSNELDGAPQIEGYTIRKFLGSGSTGTVWLARQESMDRDIALKVLHPKSGTDEQMRFLRESRILATLNHPNLVKVYDAVQAGHCTALVMEYLPGHSLAKQLETMGRLDEDEVREAILQVLAALDHAHQHGIFHRDIKPENIMLGADGKVRLADLGLARFSSGSRTLTSIDTIIGTPAYMAPEQSRDSHNVTVQSDYYSLGATAYHLLTGHPPYIADSAVDTLVLLDQGPPDDIRHHRPEIGNSTRRWVQSLMARDPDKRPRNADEAMQLIKTPDSKLPMWIGIAVSALLLIGAVVVAVISALDDDHDIEPVPRVTENPPEDLPDRDNVQQIRTLTAQNKLDEALATARVDQRIALLDLIISGYQDTPAAAMARQERESLVVEWNDRVRIMLQSHEVSLDEALAAPDFSRAQSILRNLSTVHPTNPWWRSNRTDYLNNMQAQVAGRINAWRQDRVTTANRLVTAGSLTQARELVCRSLAILTADEALTGLEQRIQQTIEETLETVRRNIRLYMSGELLTEAHDRQWDKPARRLKIWRDHDLAAHLVEDLAPLELLVVLLPALETKIEAPWSQRVGDIVEVTTRNGTRLKGRVEISPKGHPRIRVSSSFTQKILDILPPDHVTAALLQGQRDAANLHATAIWSWFVEGQEREARELMAEALKKGLDPDSAFSDIAR